MAKTSLRVFAIYLLLISVSNSYSQIVSTDSVAQFTDDELKLIRKSESNVLFLQQTLNYADLSYFSPPYGELGSPKERYVLSADISPRFVIGGEWWKFPVHIIPRYKVRIFPENPEEGDVSLPVRTPSYMPGATVYIPQKQMDKETEKIEYFSVSYFHHSNGQDGEEFNDTGEINLYNGNFSTNFIEPAFHFRNRLTTPVGNSSNCRDPKENYKDLFGKIGLEKHFLTADALEDRYGDYRLNIDLGLMRVRSYCDKIKKSKKQYTESYYREKDRLLFKSTFILGEREGELSDLKKRINMNLNYNWRIPSSPNTSLFAGVGYYGSDTYNIYFEQSYFYVNAGISLGFFISPNRERIKNVQTRIIDEKIDPNN